MPVGTYVSIITLNVNGLNAPTKRYRWTEWIQKQDPNICCLQETHFKPRDAQTESEGIGKRFSMQIEIKNKKNWSSNTHIRQI